MENYNELINSSDVVLVEFYASWCPHCQKMMPIVDGIKEIFEAKASIYQFDIDKFQNLAEKNEVETIPTFLLYKKGELKWRHSGEIPAESLSGKIQALL